MNRFNIHEIALKRDHLHEVSSPVFWDNMKSVHCFTILRENSIDHKLMISFFFFPRKQIDDIFFLLFFPENSMLSVFWQKLEKNVSI